MQWTSYKNKIELINRQIQKAMKKLGRGEYRYRKAQYSQNRRKRRSGQKQGQAVGGQLLLLLGL